jgi:hypothetical protein
MAAGINKIDDVYDTEWYREHVAKAERQNREHVARYDRSFAGIMAKSLADVELGDDGGGGASDHHLSRLADLVAEGSGGKVDRAAALGWLLHHRDGHALVRTTHKAEKESQPMTSHTELVRDVVKQYGVIALAKSMIRDQKSYGLDESTFTRLATEHAQRVYPNDRPDVAFSKLYQSEESVRRACNVLKSMPFVADITPVMVGGDAAQNVDNPAEAIEQLKQLGRDRWPSARASDQFERALTDPANAALARRAVPRPQPTTSFPWPR